MISYGNMHRMAKHHLAVRPCKLNLLKGLALLLCYFKITFSVTRRDFVLSSIPLLMMV